MQKTKLVIGAPIKHENMLWATKFFALDALVFAEIDGKKIMVVDALEYGRAKKESKVDEVLLPEELQTGEEKKGLSLEEQALLLLRKYEVPSVTAQPELSASIYKYLIDNGISIEFADPLFPERAIKTADEIADIIYAQRAMEEVFPILVDMLANAEIRNGKLWSGGEYITSEMLRLLFDSELMKRNCICDATIIASGDQAADPHCLGFGPIVADMPIVFDMFPRSRKKWYWSDMTRTVVKGKLSPQARKMYTAVLDAQCKSVEMVKASVNYFDIHKAAADFLKAQDFKTGKNEEGYFGFFHAVGHGVGLEIHEPPFVKRDKTTILEAGNVITIEPGLYYKGIGGVRVEDTMVVTETGCENLAQSPKKLTELP